MEILLLASLFIKHFIADFLLQPPYMYKNKGTLLHPGGWLHSGLHSLITLCILMVFQPFMKISVSMIILIVILELFIHYFMDYTKVNVCKKKGYTPTTHEQWFTWLGIDQTVHSLTYVGILAILIL